MIARSAELGILRTVEVFDFFDFPRLFICENRSGQRFLALSVDDRDDEHIFLYAPVSPVRQRYLSIGELPIRDVFAHPEDGFVYRVSVATESESVAHLAAEEIPANWLPDSDVRIEFDYEVLQRVVELQPAAAVAASSRRETARFALKLPGNRTDPYTRLAGNFMLCFQELLDAVAQACAGEPTLKGAIPQDILQQSQVRVSDTYPSSFGISFAADRESDLFDDSLLAEALLKVYQLLAAESDEDKLSNLLHVLRGRATSKYRALLEVMLSVNGDVGFDWGSPKSGYGGSLILSRESLTAAHHLVSAVEQQIGEEIRVVGTLIGLNARTRSYEILDVTNRQKFAGKLAADAPESIVHGQISEKYVAILKRVVEVQSTSGEERERWLLLDLLPLADADSA